MATRNPISGQGLMSGIKLDANGNLVRPASNNNLSSLIADLMLPPDKRKKRAGGLLGDTNVDPSSGIVGSINTDTLGA